MAESESSPSVVEIAKQEFVKMAMMRKIIFAAGSMFGVFLAGLVDAYQQGGAAQVVEFVQMVAVVIPIAAVLSVLVGGVIGALTMVFSSPTEDCE